MNESKPHQAYESAASLAQRSAAIQADTDILQKQWSKLSVLRFVLALLVLVSLIAVFAQDWLFTWALLLASLVGLIAAFRTSGRLGREIRLQRTRLQILSEYAARLELDMSHLPSFDLTRLESSQFSEDTQRTWTDLGITEDDGLFRLIQVLEAPNSAHALLQAFEPEAQMGTAERRRPLIEALLHEPELWLELQAHGRTVIGRPLEDPSEDNQREHLTHDPRGKQSIWGAEPALEALKPSTHEAPRWLSVCSVIARWIVPTASLAAVLILFLSQWISLLTPGLGLAILAAAGMLNWLLYLLCRSELDRELDPLAHARSDLLQAAAVFRFLEAYKPQSPHPSRATLEETLSVYHAANGASDALRTLEQVTQGALFRNQGILHLFAMMWLGWDFHVYQRLTSWRAEHGQHIDRWYQAWASLDVANSLGVLARTRRVWCWPEPQSDGTMMIHGEDVLHPLIRESTAIGNSLQAGEGTLVITGSNMSGKSTFLRTIGLSVLLAQSGGPVLAKHYRWQPMRVISSIRTQDRLSEGISSFYAEILRIRSMSDAVSSTPRQPTLLLIDEIFHGTNSADRVYGAEQALRKLSGPSTLVMVTTHDFALCDLEDDPRIQARNLHFSETYNPEGMHFDYALQEGRSTTTNARYLLALAGLINEDTQN